MSCSETCFLLTLLLLAKGYTITRGRLSLTASVKLTIFMCLYSITFIALFIYEAKVNYSSIKHIFFAILILKFPFHE